MNLKQFIALMKQLYPLTTEYEWLDLRGSDKKKKKGFFYWSPLPLIRLSKVTPTPLQLCYNADHLFWDFKA